MPLLVLQSTSMRPPRRKVTEPKGHKTCPVSRGYLPTLLMVWSGIGPKVMANTTARFWGRVPIRYPLPPLKEQHKESSIKWFQGLHTPSTWRRRLPNDWRVDWGLCSSCYTRRSLRLSTSVMEDPRRNGFVHLSNEDDVKSIREGGRNEFAPLPSSKTKNTLQLDQSLQETCQGKQYQY